VSNTLNSKEIAVRALSNVKLASKLATIGSLHQGEAKLVREEAVRRLRWPDVYARRTE
jgi:hypothetical protein